MRRITAAWLEQAIDELRTARLLLEHQHQRTACFHAQQAVEKTLKALLLERGERPPRTDDLMELLRLVRPSGRQVVDRRRPLLTNVYRGRYPGDEGLLPYGEPTSEDAARAVAAAETTVSYARRRLNQE